MSNAEEPRFIHIPETNSTNKYLQAASGNENLASGSVVLADFQTTGRGQAQSSWESEAGQNLTFSILLRPRGITVNNPFIISEMVSLSVKYTLDKYMADVSVKWPNDIYYKDSKIAGILIENTISQGFINKSIIGIGLNINQTEFHSAAPNPVSMSLATGRTLDRMKIMSEFMEIFAEQCKHINNSDANSIHDNYKKNLYRKDGFHKYSDINGTFNARIHDIEPTGHLILERTDGTLSKYAFKEVSINTDSY